ncbi:Chitin synthase 4 [Tritrichomonas musculus]|uniref:Chitin synthase 4 n=1 Tax=Tritrichomonas musculus TaxID=1915356 RepID=A0ABR2IL99_9EUKA
MAADKGHAKAMYAYGVMLYKGISVPINETEASRYFKMASDKGGIDAMAMHAHMLTKRRGLCY